LVISLLKWSKQSIRNKIFIIFVFVQLLIIGLAFYYFTHNHTNFYINQLKVNLKNSASLMLVGDKLAIKNKELVTPKRKINEWSNSIEARITIINQAGEVLADSHFDETAMNNHLNRPEIEALNSGKEYATASRLSDTLEEEMFYLAVPIINNQEKVGYLRIAKSLSFINNVLKEDIRNYLLFFIILGGITIFLSWRLTIGIISPLEKMTTTAEKIAHGDLKQRIELNNSENEIAKLASMFNYMTSQLDQKIEEISSEKSRVEAILTNMIDGVIATDVERKVLLINPAARKIFNVSEEIVLGKELISSIIHHPLDIYLQEALEKQQTINREIIYQNQGKKILQVHFTTISDHNGNVSGGVIVLTDVTELRKLETVRNDFVANVSHELRTPLTSIIGYLDTLLENDLDRQTEHSFMKIIKKEADRLAILIKDLLNLSKIEGKQPELKPDSLAYIIEKTIELLKESADKKDISININIEKNLPFVYMVSAQIEQVMINLIDNAIKYTPPDGTIKINAYQKEDKVYISIKDNGIGIPYTDQKRIFERFYRVDKARSRELGGTGIGLSIVKNIIKRHGSEIVLESELGSGSIFTFFLKIAAS